MSNSLESPTWYRRSSGRFHFQVSNYTNGNPASFRLQVLDETYMSETSESLALAKTLGGYTREELEYPSFCGSLLLSNGSHSMNIPPKGVKTHVFHGGVLQYDHVEESGEQWQSLRKENHHFVVRPSETTPTPEDIIPTSTQYLHFTDRKYVLRVAPKLQYSDTNHALPEYHFSREMNEICVSYYGRNVDLDYPQSRLEDLRYLPVKAPANQTITPFPVPTDCAFNRKLRQLVLDYIPIHSLRLPSQEMLESTGSLQTVMILIPEPHPRQFCKDIVLTDIKFTQWEDPVLNPEDFADTMEIRANVSFLAPMTRLIR